MGPAYNLLTAKLQPTTYHLLAANLQSAGAILHPLGNPGSLKSLHMCDFENHGCADFNTLEENTLYFFQNIQVGFAQTAAACRQLKIQEKCITPHLHFIFNVWICVFDGLMSICFISPESELILSVNWQFHILDPDVLRF